MRGRGGITWNGAPDVDVVAGAVDVVPGRASTVDVVASSVVAVGTCVVEVVGREEGGEVSAAQAATIRRNPAARIARACTVPC